MLASRTTSCTVDRVILAEKQQRLIADLLLIEDPQERLAAVVDRGKTRTTLTASERSEANRVKGCVSAAWVVSELRQNRCHFRGDADSPIVRGLVTFLCDFYSDASPAEVAGTEPELFERTGLARSLSPTRLNGLRSVRATIREFAGRHLP